MATIERKPKWAKWRLIPEVEVWQAVALSLDIEPDKVEFNRQAWMGARHPFKESEEFVDRLDTTAANLRDPARFPGTRNTSAAHRNCVKLDEFARFAVEFARWPVPDELHTLAGNSVASQPVAVPETANAPASAPGTNGQSEQTNGESWQERARGIADELFDRDTASGCRDSLKGYSKRVMEEMQKRQIHGPRGRIDNQNYIQREALQGAKWWQKKVK